MKPEQQRIAIAEACGLFGFEIRNGVLTGWFEIEKPGVSVPDYLNDLDAMHEAEKARINSTNECQHRNFLVLQRGDGTYHKATAAQRAEAFLRTIGKWEEDTP